MVKIPDLGLLRPRNIGLTIVLLFFLIAIIGLAGGWFRTEAPTPATTEQPPNTGQETPTTTTP